MPELPEVETVRRGLTEFIINKKITGIDVLYDGEPLNITVGFDSFTTSAGGWSGTNILNIIRVSKYNIEDMVNFAITDTDYYVDPNNPDGQIPASNAMSYFTILHEVSHCFDFLNNNWNFRGELMANFKAFYTMSLLDCNNRSDYKRAHIIWDNKCFANLSEIKQRCKVNGNGIDWMTKAAEGWKASDNKEAFWNKVDTNYRNWSDHFNCDDGINYCLLNVVEKLAGILSQRHFILLMEKMIRTIDGCGPKINIKP